MKLNWFSPLPPAKTEIANYTARLLPFLRKRAEICLWTNCNEWDPKLEEYATVRRYEPDQIAWADLNRADENIYHIGNNPDFHGAIWQVARSHPGIVVLHDIALQHLFATMHRRRNDLAGYLDLMQQHHGLDGRLAGQAMWNGQCSLDSIAEHYPFTSLALENALGVMVHTLGGFNKLKQEKCWPVCYAPLAYAASPRKNSERTDRTVGPPYQLIVFGHLGFNRRLEVLLQALADLPEKEMFRLNIYGELQDLDQLLERIQSLSLKRIVTVYGYVPEAVLDKALTSAHIAINLRYPTMGEASASQLRIWDYGLPSLVSQTGWYATLPEEAVFFVRPEHEITDIQAHLRAFLANPASFPGTGEKGRQILMNDHAPDRYVQTIMDFIAPAYRSHSRSTTHRLAERAGNEMSGWMHSPLLDGAYRKVAEEICALTNGNAEKQSKLG